MGVEYRAAIVVGLPYDDLPKDIRDDLLDREQLDAFSPYFDAPHEDCICGFSIQETDDYQFAEMDFSLDGVDLLRIKFKTLTGRTPKTYLTPYGW